MASQLQIIANRKNSQKSVGPKSKSGKRISSLNATRHGIFAKSVLIAGEDPNELAELSRAMSSEHAPQGVLEKFYVDQIVRDMWRLTRLDRAELAYYQQAQSAVLRRTKKPWDDAEFEGKSLQDASKAWSRLLQKVNAEMMPPGKSSNTMFVEADEKEVASNDIFALTILEANVARDERSPIAELDRRRRATIRDITTHLTTLYDLKDRRFTVKLSTRNDTNANSACF